MSNQKDNTAINIPFVDDEEQAMNNGHSNESLSSNDSAERARLYQRSISQRKGANLRIIIDNTDSDSEMERRDKPGPLISDSTKSVPSMGLRRNSFSMPTLNEADLDALRDLHMKSMNDEDDMETPEKSSESLSEVQVLDDGASSMACSIAEPEDEKEAPKSESESETEMPMISRSKFRTRRRASINPLPAIRLNDKEIMANSEYDTQSVISGRSVTSISSLASLLKEKVQAFPAMIRKRKKPKDYKIRIFTAILFLIIVFLVGYAYIMYNHKVMSKMYFEHIKFNSAKRLLQISNEKGVEVLSGSLAITMNIPKAYACEQKENISEECWEYSKTAKLHVSLDDKWKGNDGQESSNARCYNFRWESLNENFNPVDCFNIGTERGKWFGGGLTNNASWQLDHAKFNFTPFITGDIRYDQWGNAMRRYFINTLGVAIEVDDKSPLHVSMNGSFPGRFCLKAQYDNFAYVFRPTPLPQLKYRICTASNMKVLHHNLTQKNLWDGLKQQDMNIIKTMFDEPVWEMSGNLSDVSISNFTDSIIALGYFRLGHVLISEQWQKHVGDFEIDEERFSSLDDIITVLHRRGFRIALTIQPFVSTESITFAELVEKKLLVFERSTERTIPALTKYKTSQSVGVLDPTNSETVPWLLKKLEIITKKYQIDSFYLDAGNANDMPKFYDCREPILNPDRFKTVFMNSLTGLLSMLGVSSAIDVPRPPAFLSLPQVTSSWKGLNSVFTSAVHYGIIGYPFILPGSVGGDFIEGPGVIMSADNVPLPDKELYIRWLQLVSFLPALRFKHLPSEYRDEKLSKMALKLSSERQKTLKSVFDNYFNDALSEGLPLIRPLWMLDPTDTACLDVVDEFSIGEQVIVAPILKPNQTIREVYLPQGVWKDGIDGSLRKGSRWIHNYKVAEHDIAYFVRMPDNTRF